jgi:hypothetical protein
VFLAYSGGLMLAMSSKMMVNDEATNTSSSSLEFFQQKFK